MLTTLHTQFAGNSVLPPDDHFCLSLKKETYPKVVHQNPDRQKMVWVENHCCSLKLSKPNILKLVPKTTGKVSGDVDNHLVNCMHTAKSYLIIHQLMKCYLTHFFVNCNLFERDGKWFWL